MIQNNKNEMVGPLEVCLKSIVDKDTKSVELSRIMHRGKENQSNNTEAETATPGLLLKPKCTSTPKCSIAT
jgi:hypothetical protein